MLLTKAKSESLKFTFGYMLKIRFSLLYMNLKFISIAYKFKKGSVNKPIYSRILKVCL